MPRGGPRTSGVERALAQVEITESGCLVFAGTKNSDGYGLVRDFGRQRGVHRVIWEAAVGPIPSGLHVLHDCDNPPCCNPNHLYLGTQKDNARDRETRGRGNHATGDRNAMRLYPGILAGERHPLARVNERIVDEIRRRYRPYKVSQESLAKEYGIDQTQVSRIVRGVSWRTVR